MSILKKFLLIIFLFGLFSGASFAEYPDKNVYPDGWINGIYIGVNIGPSVSNTFGAAADDDFKALYTPTNMGSAGFASAVLGANVWFLRTEIEWLYIYNWTDIMNNTENHTGDVDVSWFPNNGQEVLNNALALNLYYDMKFISHTLYPYIGFGAGMGKQEYHMIDLEEQPNGFGEQYEGHDVVPFGQFMLGLKYDTKIIKSSFTLEYRLTSVAAVDIDPLNNGIDGLNPDGCDTDPDTCTPNPTTPTTHSRSAKSIYHSIMLGFKYYLY
ncbi:hypothetical protein HPDP_00832 [Candidatus Hepatincola sp. Pdp]